MIKKRLTKTLWYGSDKDANGNPIVPPISPSLEKHLEGLNEGEIYIHNDDENPAIFIRTTAGRIMAIGGSDIEELKKMFLRKDQDDRSVGTIASDKGFEVGKFQEGTLGSGASIFERDGNTYGEVDFLKVRKKATFTNITVQELKHVGGEIILSPAAMICSKVEETDEGYKCYFNTEDSDGRKVYNEFEIGDQARCQTFNLKSNTYYWRLVTEVGDDYIVLSKTDCDTNSDIPKVGDNISQLGNRNDTTRQAAIILSAYGSDAPSYKQYNGIDSYSLVGKQVTKLSPYGNELTGVLNIEAGSKGASNLEDFPEEVFKAVHIGAVNLLRNSGFTGDYKSEELAENTSLNSGSELYSKGLKYWTGTASVTDDIDAVSGKSATIGSLSQVVELIKGESYVVSFLAKGTSVKVMLGSDSVEQVLTESYQKYSFKFVSDGVCTFSVSGDATICDLQLERGTIATDWRPSPYDNDKTLAEFQALKYLQDAIVEGDTTILGGLILSSIIKLGNYKDGKMERVNAGVSGIYNDDDDVAMWGGGTFEQAIATVMKFKQNPRYTPTDEEWKNLANFVVTHGGDLFMRGYIHAKGGVIEHGIFRDVKSLNDSFVIDEEGNVVIVGKFETSVLGDRIIIDPENRTFSMRVLTNTGEIEVVTLSFEQSEDSYNYGILKLKRSQIGVDEYGNEYPSPVDDVEVSPMAIKLSRVGAPAMTLTNEGVSVKKGDSELRIGFKPEYGDIPSIIPSGWLADLYSNAWPTSEEQVTSGGVYNDNGTLKVKS